MTGEFGDILHVDSNWPISSIFPPADFLTARRRARHPEKEQSLGP